MSAALIGLAIALAEGFSLVGGKLLAAGLVAGLKPINEQIEEKLLRGYRRAEKDKKLQDAISSALKEAGAPQAEDDLSTWLARTGLVRLQAEGNIALRRLAARSILGFTDANAAVPEELLVALRWPRSLSKDLARLLAALRQELSKLDEWKDLVNYADAAAARRLLKQIFDQMQKLDRLVTQTQEGDALRVVLVNRGLTPKEIEEIEDNYRQDLVLSLKMHDFRGIVQMKKDIRLPLADIYLELGLLGMSSEEERQRTQQEILVMRTEDRSRTEEKRLEKRVTDALARYPRLVILGEPGSGKTMTLRFITLMLAYGYGPSRLGLQSPFIPLLVRMSWFAQEIEHNRGLSLANYLLQYIGQAYADSPHLGEFFRQALLKGNCLVLLDGMDEVGSDPLKGLPLRTEIIKKIQAFADTWCCPERPNRLVVSSRIEGYWQEALRGFEHVQLSPLRPPDEVEDFLLRWYTAHEQAYQADLTPEIADQRAHAKVDKILPDIVKSAGVRRLATNPLLLTILALIHENVGKLPNRRIRLYEICAQTLIDTWRQAQTGQADALLVELGDDTVIRIMATLAYWLHEEKPGGTASYKEWQTKLQEILVEEGFELAQAKELVGRFLDHARYAAGLLAERGLDQFGFFHLTFEEYLAARQVARQRVEIRKAIVIKHGADARWQEVFLLAAGQLGICEGRTDDVGDFVEDLLAVTLLDDGGEGQQSVLAGRALLDIGTKSIKLRVLNLVRQRLQVDMQDLHSESRQPGEGGRVPILTRAEAADTLDALGWLPDDLYRFALVTPGAGAKVDYPFAIALHPVTNVQYERFLKSGDFDDPQLWTHFPKYDQNCRLMKEDWGNKGWEWLQERQKDQAYSPDSKIVLPRYWQDVRFGIARRGVPVTGITWYEANAYCRWLFRHWNDAGFEEGAANPGLQPKAIRLPLESEWARAAGGEENERYAWDTPGPATQEMEEIVRRANVAESQIGRTTPTALYPLGRSLPYQLWDLSGNVFEWQANYYDKDHDVLALRGGSWSGSHRCARVSFRRASHPHLYWRGYGLRVVVLPR